MKKILLILVLITAITSAYNMFGYPAYFDDEGTYMSQALAVVNTHKLAPYTYWYDHAPVGWLVIAGWLKLVGGIHAFGMGINTGRVLMLLIHVVSTALVYVISWKLTGRRLPSIFGSLIYALSPLVGPLSRMVFLDNIMMLFVLSALALLVAKRRTLWGVLFAGILMGLAVLTKESALFLIPGMTIGLLALEKAKRRIMGLGIFVMACGLVIMLYPLYAILKGELLPAADPSQHVSLLTTFLWQAGRKGGAAFSPDSQFYFTLFNSWLATDAPLVVFGFFSSLAALVMAVFKKTRLIVPLTTLGYVGYLIRGGIINDQYFIPLSSLFVINLAIAISGILGWLKNKRSFIRGAGYGAIIGTMLLWGWFYSQKLDMYFLKATEAQIKAVQWIKDLNLNENNETAAIDGYALTELLPISKTDVYNYVGAHHYWKIDQDPTLRKNVYKDTWTSIDYLLVNNKVRRDTEVSELPLVKRALDNSTLVAEFKNPEVWYEKVKPYGPLWGHLLIVDPGTTWIYKLDDRDLLVLQQAWQHYRWTFVHDYGQTIDPQTGNTTSEGQAYSMLKAVWSNDEASFDGVYQWTKDHLQYRGDKLISWLWKDNKLGDSNSASDADVDLAAALLLGGKKWNKAQYTNEAKVIINDIWTKEVKMVNGRYLLTSAAQAENGDYYLVNPSYFSPAYFRLFAEYDKTKPWTALANDSYYWWANVQNPSTGLVPNWIEVSKVDGSMKSAHGIMGNDADIYGFDAFRAFFRAAQDYQWYNTPAAKQFLTKPANFFEKEWKKKNNLAAVYTTSGQAVTEYGSLSTGVGTWSAFIVVKPELANEIFNLWYRQNTPLKIVGFWGDKNNYYDQNWAWFGYGLQIGALEK